MKNRWILVRQLAQEERISEQVRERVALAVKDGGVEIRLGKGTPDGPQVQDEALQDGIAGDLPWILQDLYVLFGLVNVDLFLSGVQEPA